MTSLHKILHLLRSYAEKKDIRSGRHLYSSLFILNTTPLQVSNDYFIRFFGSFGTLLESNLVFLTIPHPSIYTWHAIISSHVIHGEHHHALVMYHIMLQDGIQPNRYIYTCILKACGVSGIVMCGEIVHDSIIRDGFELCVDVGGSIVDMYASCGRVEDARKVFDNLPRKDHVTWSAFLDRLILNGCGDYALEIVKDLQNQDIIKPDKVMFISALRVCGLMGSMVLGNVLHGQITENGLETEITVTNTLIDMYSKCGALNEACVVFDKLKTPSTVSWGVMISAYATHGQCSCALRVLKKMQENHMEMNEVVILNALKACGGSKAIDQGRLLHHHIIKSGMKIEYYGIDCALIDMYAKCGSLNEAHCVFDMQPHHNVVSWGAIIAGHAQNGHDILAYKFFQQMHKEGMKPGIVTYLCVLKGIMSTQLQHNGKHIHHGIIHDNFESDETIGNMLVDVYAKFGGSIEDAFKVFDKLKNPSKVSWSSLMGGYVKHGDGLLGLELFTRMQQKGIEPDKVAYLSALKACSSTSTLMHGKLIHNQVVRSGHEHDTAIGNALIDMYVKCRCIKEAHKVFDCLAFQDIVAWGTMVGGYAIEGNYRLVDIFFEVMQQHGFKPNSVTFTSLLSACCQESAIKEGEFYFNIMETYGVIPTIEHVTCMVDLLGGAGYLNDAKRILNISSSQCNIIGWMSLLTACKTYGNVKLGRQCFDKLVLLNPEIGAMYVLMSNIYASANMWEHVRYIDHLQGNACAWKVLGKTSMEMN